MTLIDLIRRPVSRKAATAIPAIPAIPTTPPEQGTKPVARIATIAVASPSSAQPTRPAMPANPELPAAGQISPADPAHLIDVYTERLAICSEAGDVPQETAHLIAIEECGAPLDQLAARLIAYWRHCIETLPEPADRRLAGIKTICLGALAEHWARDAARLGWNEREMFGLDPAAPTVQNRNGLLTSLALTAFRRPVRIVEIRAGEAVIVTGSGSILRHFNTGHAGPSIWEHPAFRRLN